MKSLILGLLFGSTLLGPSKHSEETQCSSRGPHQSTRTRDVKQRKSAVADERADLWARANQVIGASPSCQPMTRRSHERRSGSASGRNRTFNLGIKSPLLCQLSYGRASFASVQRSTVRTRRVGVSPATTPALDSAFRSGRTLTRDPISGVRLEVGCGRPGDPGIVATGRNGASCDPGICQADCPAAEQPRVSDRT